MEGLQEGPESDQHDWGGLRYVKNEWMCMEMHWRAEMCQKLKASGVRPVPVRRAYRDALGKETWEPWPDSAGKATARPPNSIKAAWKDAGALGAESEAGRVSEALQALRGVCRCTEWFGGPKGMASDRARTEKCAGNT